MLTLDAIKKRVKVKSSFNKNEVFSIINQVSSLAENDNPDKVYNVGKVYKPKKLAKYDIVTAMVCAVPHPCIVYKVTPEYVYVVAMSTTVDAHNIMSLEKSRIFSTSYITNTVIRLHSEDAREQFVGIFDNKCLADEGFRQLKKLYKDVFKFTK